MRSALRVAVAFLAIASHGALAQTAVPPTLTVQRLAPQLVAFAGSQNNFQSLVTGLAQGTPVQLITVLPDGFTQVVTFTPTAAMSPTNIAQFLETARQQLIGLGIGAPTAEQIGIALMGGVVPTALGGSQVPGVLNAPAPSPAVQIQSAAAAGATTSTTPSAATGTPTAAVPGVTNAVNVQLVPNTVPPGASTSATAVQRVNTSDSPIPAGATSRTPLPAPVTSTTPVPGTPSAPEGTAPTRSTPPVAVTPPVGRTPDGSRPAVTR
jgi:hypothetical protein